MRRRIPLFASLGCRWNSVYHFGGYQWIKCYTPWGNSFGSIEDLVNFYFETIRPSKYDEKPLAAIWQCECDQRFNMATNHCLLSRHQVSTEFEKDFPIAGFILITGVRFVPVLNNPKDVANWTNVHWLPKICSRQDSLYCFVDQISSLMAWDGAPQDGLLLRYE